MKIRIVLAVFVIAIVASIMTGVIIRRQKKIIVVNPILTSKTLETSVSRKTWDDPAGFTVTYDTRMDVNAHPEDNDNYAHVEFTMKNDGGSIVIWASDTNAQTIEDWMTPQKRFIGANVVDTTFGGQPAKKIRTTSVPGSVTTAALYDGLVFSAELHASDSPSIGDEYDSVIDSFVFKPVQTAISDTGASDGTETTYDEEEIVE